MARARALLRLFVACLVKIDRELVVALPHEQVRMVEHGMLPSQTVRLALPEQLVNLFRFMHFVILAKYISDTQGAETVVVVDFEDAEVRGHGVSEAFLLTLDVLPEFRRLCIVNIGQTDSRVTVAVITMRQRVFILIY